jgi:ADP-heptose:LPS heptosyltransferase
MDMSTPGRPKGEFLTAQPEGTPVRTPGRHGSEGARAGHKGEYRSAQHESTPVTRRTPMHLPPAVQRRWQAARHVLAVRLDNLGDVLMTTPALAAIRHALPQARITLLASPAGAALAPHLPCVDQAIAFEAPWTGGAPPDSASREGRGGSLGRRERQLTERLAAQRFDAAIIFTVCTQSALPAALLCRMAGIPLRLAHARENPYALLSDWIPDTDVMGPGLRHEVARQLALVGALGWSPPDLRLQLQFGAQHVRRALVRLAQAGVQAAQPYFVVHCGASAASRRYPAPQFGAAAELIARRSGLMPVFTGSAAEAGWIAQARQAMTQPSAALDGRLDLGGLAALIAGARVLVAGNTGPVHVAAAVGTPVVDLYALTNPQHTPWQVPARVLNRDVPCRYCLKSLCPQGHQGCLHPVTPEEVAAAALELLELPASRGVRKAPLEPPPPVNLHRLVAVPAARSAA